jgi:hypothetical protein
MQLLKKHNACNEAREWAKDKTIEEAFTTCHRGDWMLWLFAKTNPEDLQRLTLAKGHCANTVRNLIKDEQRVKAVDVAIAFGEGKATRDELDAADEAGLVGVGAAAYAAYAAYYAVYASASASAAAYARKENQLQAADICRKYLPLEIWNVK